MRKTAKSKCANKSSWLVTLLVLALAAGELLRAQQWATSGNDIYNTNTGNVGIGTTAPASLFHVVNDATLNTYISAAGVDKQANLNIRSSRGNHATPLVSVSGDTVGGLMFHGHDGTNYRPAADISAQIDGTPGTADMPGRLVFSTTPDGSDVQVERMRITNAGNVGIGTTAPAVRLDTRGEIRAGGNSSGSYGLRLTYDGVSDAGVIQARNFQNSLDRPLALNPDGGNVGIGTSSPSSKLHVNGSGNTVLTIEDTTGNPWLAFKNTSGTMRLQYQVGSDFLGIYDQTGSAWRAAFTRSGNVGIGTTVPAAKLHVAGDIKADGNIAAKYQDLAEWVPASTSIAAGSVVVLDRERSNQVLSSTRSYDTAVAGVVSSAPGILLGEAGEGKVKVATTGRVKVKVDASKGSISVGDLLVTSNKEGAAMRSEPLELAGVKIHRPGTLIGKALEPLTKGEGEILVLLSLQ